MTTKVDSSNLLAERAYSLWEKTENEEPREIAQEKIIRQLFREIKERSPFFSWFYSLVEFLHPSWMKRKVERALSAYKYDLIFSDKYGSRLGLFSNKERWIIEQKLVGIFKNIIGRKTPLSLKQKAVRWKSKVQKYHGKRELMIGSYLLFQIGQKFPNIRNSIDWMKALNMSYIERQCKETLENVDDDEIVQGLTHYLAQPFDETKGLFRVFSEIIYYVTKEKAKITAKALYTSGTNGIYSLGRSIFGSIRSIY